MKLRTILAKKISQAELLKDPIDHIVIDDFYPEELVKILSSEFEDYESDYWHIYSNSIEEKRTCNQWNLFKSNTYSYFSDILSKEIADVLSEKFAINLEADYGLHGGGQHIHSFNGNLNPHLDYSIHPKIKLQRRINAIFYLTDDFKEEDGGHFGLWGNESPEKPGALIKEYSPIFNRIVIFNTSQNSWHGLSRLYSPQSNKYRKSLASYYVSEPSVSVLQNTRALFAPREAQLNNPDVLEEIVARVDENRFKNSYIKIKK
jgi:Rps23 Pro-64 3,4-dihydroxylase Tpa1-like proline 4-hydroxylase